MAAEDLPTDILNLIVSQYIGDFVTLWSMSRTCWKMYRNLNPHLRIVAWKLVEKRCREMYSPGIQTLGLADGKWAVTGSIPWSVFMGERWEKQDIDVTYEGDASQSEFLTGHEVDDGCRCLGGSCLCNEPSRYDEIENNRGCVIVTVERQREGRFNVYFKKVSAVDVFRAVNDSIQETVDGYDILGCQCYVNPTTLYIPKPYLTLFGVSEYKANHFPPYRTGSSYNNSGRLEKYANRGIRFVGIDGDDDDGGIDEL
jgi:hypothetical protein